MYVTVQYVSGHSAGRIQDTCLDFFAQSLHAVIAPKRRIVRAPSTTEIQSDQTGLPWFISTDDHMVEPPHMYDGRLPSRLKDRTQAGARAGEVHGPRRHVRRAARRLR